MTEDQFEELNLSRKDAELLDYQALAKINKRFGLTLATWNDIQDLSGEWQKPIEDFFSELISDLWESRRNL